MNLFNRLVIILLILAAMTLTPLILIFPEQAEYTLRYTADVIQSNLDWLNNLSLTAYVGMRVLLVAVGGMVFVIGLLFLALEVVRIRRKTVKLKDGSGELMMDGIAGHLAYHIDLLADVLRVKPRVVSKGKSVRVSLYVDTAPGINIPAKTAELKETARQVIEEQLGLQLKGEVKVVIKPLPYPGEHVRKGRGRSRRPSTPARAPRGRGLEPTPRTETVPTVTKRTCSQVTTSALDEGFTPPMEASELAQEEKSQIIEVKGPSS